MVFLSPNHFDRGIAVRICLIVDDYVPDSIKVAAKMMHELSIQFTELGHEVTVVTPGVGLHQSMDLSVIDGVKVCRFSSGRIKNVNKVTRAINESLLSFRAWISCRRFLKRTHMISSFITLPAFSGVGLFLS